MAKKEKEVLKSTIEGHEAKFYLRSPAEIKADQKRKDKTTAMKITLTYIESQNMKATPKKTMEIADQYEKWLRK